MSKLLLPNYCDDNNDYTIESKLEVSSLDTTALLIDFMSDVLTLSYTKKAVFCKVEVSSIDKNHLTATIYGNEINGFEEDIKAVTYHEAEVIKNDEGIWETLVIVDI